MSANVLSSLRLDVNKMIRISIPQIQAPERLKITARVIIGRNNKIQKTIPSPALARKSPIILPEIDYYYCFREPTGKLT